MKNEMHKFILALAGIAAIFGLESIALFNGVNGTVYTASVSGITLIVGYGIGKWRQKNE